MTPSDRATIRRSIIIVTISRLVVNMTRRFAYPFLPSISRELNVPLASVQSVVATQGGVGIASPLFGSLSERYGRKQVMVVCLALMTLTAGIGWVAPVFGVFAAVMLAFGVYKMVYDPTMHAYIADQVPYHRRGFAIGIAELSWAGALIVAAPVTGLLLGRFGLRGVFLTLMLASMSVTVLMLWKLPTLSQRSTTIASVNPLSSWRILRKHPSALAALAYSLTLVAANEVLIISYGAWMEDAFGLSLEALGIASITIAVAEVIGEFSVIGLADRFGARRLATVGALVSSLFYLLLPALSFHLVAGLLGLALAFVAVEIAIVSSLSLITELVPDARAVVLSSNMAAYSIGRWGGALLGGLLYSTVGSFGAVGAAACAIGLVATFIIHFLIKNPEHLS